ncbi:unnamed protein product [Amaranthus hypochondriacus]
MNSLTNARFLIQTKTQCRIDECVKIDWGLGSCDIWVKEVECCECLDVGELISKRSKDNEEDEMEDEENLIDTNAMQPLEHEEVNASDIAQNLLVHVEVQGKNDLVMDKCYTDKDETAQNTVHNGVLENNEKKLEPDVINVAGCVTVEHESIVEHRISLEMMGLGCHISNNNRVLQEVQEVQQVDEVRLSTLGPEPCDFTGSRVNEAACYPSANVTVAGNFERNGQEVDDVVNPIIDNLDLVLDSPSCAENGTIMVQDPIAFEQRIPLIRDATISTLDPMVSLEAGLISSAPQLRVHGSLPLSAPSKRPRGRPKKRSTPLLASQPLGLWSENEAQTTWDVAKRMGISTNDEGAALSILRKSRRLINLEGSAP